MRKLKLQVEDLKITAFTTGERSAIRGTIMGHKPPAPTSFQCELTYVGVWTCDYTCADSCQNGCMSLETDCGGCG